MPAPAVGVQRRDRVGIGWDSKTEAGHASQCQFVRRRHDNDSPMARGGRSTDFLAAHSQSLQPHEDRMPPRGPARRPRANNLFFRASKKSVSRSRAGGNRGGAW